jgi:hypothetical protein
LRFNLVGTKGYAVKVLCILEEEKKGEEHTFFIVLFRVLLVVALFLPHSTTAQIAC